MTPLEQLWAELEADQSWRFDEIRFLQNQATTISEQEKQDQMRRAMILLLYAHFEGFCKFALIVYVNTINNSRIKCSEANYAIAAASLSDLFQALRDPNSKCEEFKSVLPDDSKLHRFARDREFFLRMEDFKNRIVSIPEDVVDTESNLKPVVLRKNLYRLGFPHDKFRAIEGKINRLIEYRNGIAHGKFKAGIPIGTYEELRDAAFAIMNDIKRSIMEAVQDKHYLKTAS